MDENKPENIFDAAGKAKKPTPLKKDVPPAAAPKKIQDSHQETDFGYRENILDLHRDPEINTMLNKMYRIHEDYQTKLSDAYDQSGVSTSQIKNYLGNPSNFSPEIWQKIQRQRESLEKKLGDVLQNYTKKRKKSVLAGPGGEISKERKSKTLGIRKKWIPM